MRATPGSVRVPAWLAVVLLAPLVAAGRPEVVRAAASVVPTGFVDQSMASSLDQPTGITGVPDTLTRRAPRVMFVEQRTARVRVLADGTLFTLGTVPSVVSVEVERGLLGIAVDPAWPTRPFIYVHYTDGRSGHHVAISRFTVTGDLDFTGTGVLQFDPASRYDLLNSLSDNAINHNGGSVRFGPDRMLYVSLGDDATRCPAQDITFLGGKILRLDVSRLPGTGAGPAPFALLIPPGNPFATNADSSARLVWSYGLRNPFRFSIDPQTGVLYVADVGENATEEVDRIATGGMNMGWPIYEGSTGFTSCTQTPPGAPVGPIYTYNHGQGTAIIGAGLYRRPGNGAAQFPIAYEGDCFALDYVSGIFRRLKGSGTSWALAATVPGQPSTSDWGNGFASVSDVVEMVDGSLWYCRQSNAGAATSGELRRIAYAPLLDVATAGAGELVLLAPRPSPSMRTASLTWSQPRRGAVRLAVYDLGGRCVRTLQDRITRDAGTHAQVWDGREDSGAPASAGIYYARLESGDASRQVRITLLR